MKFIDYPTKVGDGPFLYTGTLDGEKAWSDGWVMFLGEHPDDGQTWKSKDFSHAINGGDPGGMPEIRPICVKALGSGECAVWFSDCATFINYRFFLAAYERFGRVRYFSDGKHQLVLRRGSKRVGIICRLKHCQLPEDVAQLIQERERGTPQPANDNPEERQKPK